ncbi:MAG: hypothetical protein HFF50_03315 [Lawsonibacter sp.]|nr:hypothetical protein [Lawsonibacter sp.]
MANCPWYRSGCCKRNGMLMTCNLTDPAICMGRQRQGMTFRDCQYYVNPREGTSENMRPCPLCIRVERRGRYYAYCKSVKFPGADGENGLLVSDEQRAYICVGHQVRGKKYTSCPYYKGGKPRKPRK